jgi:hypothetical protein
MGKKRKRKKKNIRLRCYGEKKPEYQIQHVTTHEFTDTFAKQE